MVIAFGVTRTDFVTPLLVSDLWGTKVRRWLFGFGNHTLGCNGEDELC